MCQNKARWIVWVLMCVVTASANSQTPTTAKPVGQIPSSRQISNRLEKGYRLERENKKTEALAVFNGVLKSDPSNHAALIELGYLNLGFKHWTSAAKYLKAASEQDPGNSRLHMDLGYAYQSLKDYENAATEFQKVANEPGEFQSQAQAALDIVKSSQQASKSSADTRQAKLLNRGYEALSKGNKALARKEFEAALARDPGDMGALKQLGFLDLSEGKLSSAARRFESARNADSNDYFASLQLGYIYARQNKPQQAQEAFKTALGTSDPQIHAAAEAALQPGAGNSGTTEPAQASAPAPQAQ